VCVFLIEQHEHGMPLLDNDNEYPKEMEHHQLYDIGGIKWTKEQIIDLVERYPPMPFEPYKWGEFKCISEYLKHEKEQKKKKKKDEKERMELCT
jgi:hypothetical protein